MKKLLLILFSMNLLNVTQAQEPPGILTFGIVTDIHYADIPDNDNKAYSRSLEKLRECVDTMNRNKVDFLAELGDFKDMPSQPSEEKALVYLYRVEKVFSGFSGPRYHVLGNHDEDCISKSQFYSIAKNTGIESGRTYYSFEHKGFTFIILDANYDSVGKDYEKGKFEWGDPNIPASELKWLKKELKKSRCPVIVFVHQLLDGEGQYSVDNATEVREIMEESGKVAAVFSGHFHEGQYRMINGIHYYTLRAMVDGTEAGDNSFAIVTLEEDRISIKGFGRAVSMSFSIPR